jgi:1-acyl-sn-glycerol-3-phosphate acyltransferase
MLTYDRLEHIRLTSRPMSHRILGHTFLWGSYDLLRRVKITVEGIDKLPAHPVMFAMNHTDRFNYWPFQYWLYHHRNRFTATWVKGKYYESPMVAKFMEATNNIPTVSKGYVLSKDFHVTIGRKPTDAEYEALRPLLDDALYGQEGVVSLSRPDAVPAEFFATARSILGEPYDPASDTWAAAAARAYSGLMKRFVDLNRQALDAGCDIIVFPEGTRSVTVRHGHIGLAQMALSLGLDVVPVGCSGCDRIYPGSSPWPRPGAVTYRVGDPIPHARLRELAPVDDFTPFNPADERRLRQPFTHLVDHVMDRINELVDERHRRRPEHERDAQPVADRYL